MAAVLIGGNRIFREFRVSLRSSEEKVRKTRLSADGVFASVDAGAE